MTLSRFKSKIKEAMNSWKDAKEAVAEGFGANISDGKYEALLVEMELQESQASGRLQIMFKYKITEGSNEGRFVFNYGGIETFEQQRFTARDIQALGYEPPDDLGDSLNAIIEDARKNPPAVLIQLKTSGDYQNVRILELLALEDEEPEEDEDVEFDVGDYVAFKVGKKEVTGEIVKLNDDSVQVLRADNGKKITVKDGEYTLTDTLEPESEDDEDDLPFDEEEPENDVEESEEDEEESEDDEPDEDEEEDEEESEDDEDDEAELEVGTRIMFDIKMKSGKTKQVSGEVTELIDSEVVKVKRDDNGKYTKVSLENIVNIVGDPANVNEEPENEPEEDDDEVKEGDTVQFTRANQNITGTVVKIMDDGSIAITRDDTGKIAKVKAGKFTKI